MAMEEMVQRARVAMEEISGYTQAEVDKMLYAISKAVFEQAEPLAKLAIEETGLGRLDHKIGKNQGMATNIFASLKNKASVGVIREIPEEGLVEIAHPRGVIGSVTPTTNPTITPLGNGLMALKGKNAMIVSPHPRSKKTTKETIELMREALVSVGAPRDLLQVIEEPSIELSQELMKSVDLIVATGGPGLVKSAYSSGHPAYGVGPVMTKALHSVSNSGTFVPLAVTQKNFEVNTFFDLVFGNKKVRGVLIGDTIAKYHLPNLIEFYKRGEFPFDQFIKYYDFENINQAEADSISGEVIKAVVVMDKDYQPPK